MRTHTRHRLLNHAAGGESGIALMTTLMVLLLLSSLLVGFTAMIASETRLGGIDARSADSFYAAHAGIEKLTSDLGQLFSTDFSPTWDAVRALGDDAPDLDDVSWVEPDGSDGYRVDFLTTTGDPATGDPVAENKTITSGPYAGFIGLMSEYTVSITGRSMQGAESSLERVLQTVSIPVFQFGTFSETDLSVFPGPVFDFGGRVHTNGNLFLASSNRVTMSDKVTAVGQIVRAYLANGESTSSRNGDVDVITSPGNYRDLKINEGSVVGDENSAANEPSWSNLSTGTYNSNITNGGTGVKKLELPIVNNGALPVDLVRRPLAAEDPSGLVFPQRHFAIASVRILLSDLATDITSLPTVTATPPIRLDAQVELGGDPDNPWVGYTVDANNPPLAVSLGTTVGVPAGRDPVAEGYRFAQDTTLHGGFIKIEYQNAQGNWNDVTNEILNLGLAAPSYAAGCLAQDPNPNAVIRIQRIRYDGNLMEPGGTGCGNGSQDGYDYWPLVLYDTREGNFRDGIPTGQNTMFLAGVMHYVELDVNNLRRWLQGSIGTSGNSVLDQNGYVVYFSDRRGNRDFAGNETGEFGFEDFVNSASGSGTPNGALDTGEDVNANGSLDIYGGTPGVVGQAPLDATATPTTLVDRDVARVNRAIFFRRALKVRNGALGNIPMPGLAITAENQVYLEGDFNASGPAGGFVEPNAATSIMADAVSFCQSTGRMTSRSTTRTTGTTATRTPRGIASPSSQARGWRSRGPAAPRTTTAPTAVPTTSYACSNGGVARP